MPRSVPRTGESGASVAEMRRPPRICWSVLAVVLVSAGCATAQAGHPAGPATIVPGQAATQAPGSAASAAPAVLASPPSPDPAASSGQARQPQPRPLAGRVIGIDPGHNGGNFDDPEFIGTQIWNGLEDEDCDTTGTQTDSGYTEAQFNFNVARYLRAILRADGARVVMTRSSNKGVGPCVTTRAQIINHAHANVAVDIHADGGPASGRGFTVLEPVSDGPNDQVIAASVRFGADVKSAMLARTSMPASDYYGVGGVIYRDDLAGLNLTTVPKILVECGNMRNATDAALLIRPSYQREIAAALAAAITRFLRR
jgi:N-acetylmuramoyl-L-alanine amidase